MGRICKALLLVIGAVCAVSVSAQTPGAKGHDALVGELNAAAKHCESLDGELAALRVKYGELADGAERAAVGERIVAMEVEAFAAKNLYKKLVAEVSRLEIDSAGQEGAKGADVAVPAPPKSPAWDKRIRADLVRNGIFARELSAEDYRTLLAAQRDEAKAAEIAAGYLDLYKSLVSIRRAYMATESEQVADSLMTRFDIIDKRMEQTGQELAQCWLPLVDNKTYLYHLVMEKGGYNDALAYYEQTSAETAGRVGELEGRYSSDALVSYGLWKKWLASYEERIASTLQLRASQDSLQSVVASLNPEVYNLAPVTVERRYFLEYEPIKVIKPSIYNSLNPVPPVKVYEHGTMFRIRVGIFSKMPNISALRGITPLSYLKLENGRRAYFVGGFKSADEARKGVAYLKRLGFRDPIVAAWRDGDYISDHYTWEKERVHEYNIELSGVAALPDEVRRAILVQNPTCVFSKVGNTFVAGKFDDRRKADALVAEIVGIDSSITAKTVDITRP